MKYILFVLLILCAGFVMAETQASDSCTPDMSKFSGVTNYSLAAIGGAQTLIGNDKVLEFKIDDTKFYYLVKDGFVNSVDSNTTANYIVSTDACTIQRIFDGSDPMQEYKAGKIKLQGTNAGTSIRMWFARTGLHIYGWFR